MDFIKKTTHAWLAYQIVKNVQLHLIVWCAKISFSFNRLQVNVFRWVTIVPSSSWIKQSFNAYQDVSSALKMEIVNNVLKVILSQLSPTNVSLVKANVNLVTLTFLRLVLHAIKVTSIMALNVFLVQIQNASNAAQHHKFVPNVQSVTQSKINLALNVQKIVCNVITKINVQNAHLDSL